MPCEHDIALVPLRGSLTVRNAAAVQRALYGLIDKGNLRIVLNMAHVAHVDAAGMGVLIATVRRMRDQGGLVSLINVNPRVMHSLKIARLVDLIPVAAAGERKDVPELGSEAMPLWRTTLSVDKDDLCSARGRVSELANKMSFGPDDVFDLTLAVGEALGNAADHTCGDSILATVSAYRDRMVVEVTDCGEGFGERNMPGGDSLERGRGIRLMELLVDSVTISPRPSGRGTVVKLVKLV